MDKKKAVWLVLIVWTVVWILFLVRPYFKNNLLKEYADLIPLSTEDKRVYVTGSELYEFIQFCSNTMNPPSSYRIVGVEDASLDHRRARYYLYPNIEHKAPEFILVYKMKGFAQDGYSMFASLDSEKYILKKVR